MVVASYSQNILGVVLALGLRIMGISPLLHAKSPTLDHPDHRVEFMVQRISQLQLITVSNNTNIFMIFIYILSN